MLEPGEVTMEDYLPLIPAEGGARCPAAPRKNSGCMTRTCLPLSSGVPGQTGTASQRLRGKPKRITFAISTALSKGWLNHGILD